MRKTKYDSFDSKGRRIEYSLRKARIYRRKQSRLYEGRTPLSITDKIMRFADSTPGFWKAVMGFNRQRFGESEEYNNR